MRRLATTLIIFACLVLAACPKPGGQGNNSGAAATSNPTIRAATAKLKRPYPLKYVAAEEFPPEAVAYFELCLDNLASREFPPKDMTFAKLGMLPGCQVGREKILRQVTLSGEVLLPALSQAYLAVAPEDCLSFMRRQMLAGNTMVLENISNDDEVARWVMEHIEIPEGNAQLTMWLTEAIQILHLDHKPYLPLLQAVLDGDDPVAANVMSGFIIQIGEGTAEIRESLSEGFASDDPMLVRSASEGIRKSDDQAFVETLEPYVTGEIEQPLGDGTMELDRKEYAAYSLMSLEGEPARELRRQLLGSDNLNVKWMAALGELLHGDPEPWNGLVANSDQADPYFWNSLQAPDVQHVDLLPGLKWKMESAVQGDRYRVLDTLMRDRPDHRHPMTVETIRMGIEDEIEMIRERAWVAATICCPELFADEALAVLQDAEEAPKVRIAAAACAMKPVVLRANGRLDEE